MPKENGLIVGQWHELNVEVNYKYNGELYLVRHKSISDQAIGSGKTLGIALDEAEISRNRIIKARGIK